MNHKREIGSKIITEVSRRAIIDHFTISKTSWAGRYTDDAFLGRLYDLTALPSYDNRYQNAAGDIFQHRVRNDDWEQDWVFTDQRFNLLRASDNEFLRFLCETVHPVVRPSEDDVAALVEVYNKALSPDGWRLVAGNQISGRPVYVAQFGFETPWRTKAVDISRHTFYVGLSFPGEARALVEEVAQELEKRIGPNSYFYDNNYISQLARPSLDTLLQDIYRNRSRLIVVFLSSDYQRKEWCGLEFRAIREIIMERDHHRVMFVRTDDGSVEGVFRTDGYIDARRFLPAQIAHFICERVDLFGNT